MKRKGEAKSGRWKGSGLAPAGVVGGGGREEEVSADGSEAASTASAGLAGAGEEILTALRAFFDFGGWRVVRAEGSTEMRSPGCSRMLGSETCEGAAAHGQVESSPP